jgi:hypothetical protein
MGNTSLQTCLRYGRYSILSGRGTLSSIMAAVQYSTAIQYICMIQIVYVLYTRSTTRSAFEFQRQTKEEHHWLLSLVTDCIDEQDQEQGGVTE